MKCGVTVRCFAPERRPAVPRWGDHGRSSAAPNLSQALLSLHPLPSTCRNMSMTIAHPRGPLTLEDALDDQNDILPKLTALRDTPSFRDQLEARRSDIEDIISRHLNLPLSKFKLDSPSAWIPGGFNMCLAIDIHDQTSTRLPRTAVIRFAMPHAIGESHFPGVVDEKVRCEAATYVWLERECPAIPIPRLLGMGFPGSRTVSKFHLVSLALSCSLCDIALVFAR